MHVTRKLVTTRWGSALHQADTEFLSPIDPVAWEAPLAFNGLSEVGARL